eukprot:1136268-Pelagomonas_calceolata.AAC.3
MELANPTSATKALCNLTSAKQHFPPALGSHLIFLSTNRKTIEQLKERNGIILVLLCISAGTKDAAKNQQGQEMYYLKRQPK